MRLKISLFFFILIYSLSSCKDSETKFIRKNPNLEEEYKSKNNEIEIKWLKFIPLDGDTIVEQEIYLYPNGDTLFNQRKVYVRNKLVSSKSLYYELELKKQSIGKYKVILNYFSYFDTINPKSGISRKIVLEFLQNDTLKVASFENENPTMKFEYLNDSSSTFYGIVKESIIRKIGFEEYEITLNSLIIDNTNPTKNPVRIENIGQN